MSKKSKSNPDNFNNNRILDRLRERHSGAEFWTEGDADTGTITLKFQERGPIRGWGEYRVGSGRVISGERNAVPLDISPGWLSE